MKATHTPPSTKDLQNISFQEAQSMVKESHASFDVVEHRLAQLRDIRQFVNEEIMRLQDRLGSSLNPPPSQPVGQVGSIGRRI